MSEGEGWLRSLLRELCETHAEECSGHADVLLRLAGQTKDAATRDAMRAGAIALRQKSEWPIDDQVNAMASVFEKGKSDDAGRD